MPLSTPRDVKGSQSLVSKGEGGVDRGKESPHCDSKSKYRMEPTYISGVSTQQAAAEHPGMHLLTNHRLVETRGLCSQVC